MNYLIYVMTQVRSYYLISSASFVMLKTFYFGNSFHITTNGIIGNVNPVEKNKLAKTFKNLKMKVRNFCMYKNYVVAY